MTGRAIGIILAFWAGLATAQPAPQPAPPVMTQPAPAVMSWGPAPTIYPPKLVVQFGHDTPVNTAAWLSGDSWLVTASGFDMMVIVWDASTGEIINRIPMPLLDRRGVAVDPQVTAITTGATGGRRTATIVVVAYGTRPNGNLEGQRYRLTVDLVAGRFDPVPAPAVITVAAMEAAAAAAARQPLPAATDRFGQPARLFRSPDGKLLVERSAPPVAAAAGNGVRLVPAVTAIALAGVEKGYFSDAALSPDGFRLARLARSGETSIWDSRGNVVTAGPYAAAGHDRIGWIGNAHIYTAGAATAAALAVIDAGSGRGIGSVPARCLMAPVGDEGLFVAAGPGSCGAAAGAADGLWFFDRDDPAGRGFTLARHWRQRRLPPVAAREIVTALTVGPSEHGRAGHWEIYAATRPRQLSKGAYPVNWLHVGSDAAQPAEFLDFFKAADQRGLTPKQMIARRLAVSRSGKIGLWAFSGEVRLVNDSSPANGVSIPTLIDIPSLLDSDDRRVAIASPTDNALQLFDAADGHPVARLPVPGVLTGGYLDPLPLLWAASGDGSLRFWDTRPAAAQTGVPANWVARDGAPLLQYFSFPDGRFFAALPDGRYDTNLGADTDAVRWIMPHRPFEPLPAQTFMRSRYEPDLMRRLMACLASGDCTAAFPPLPDVRALNRAVPVTRIVSVVPVPGAHAITVTVETREGVDQIDGPAGSAAFQTSGAHDLRLFMDGRLVRQFPDVLMTRAVADDDAAWRAATALPKVKNPDPDCGNCYDVPATQSFTMPIPSDGQALWFGAYAFNMDRIKGPTWPYRYQPPPAALPERPRRTVVVAIGIDATANPDWRLRYAANDAEQMVQALASLPGTVVPVLLVARDGTAHAAKADIAAVLRRLNGFDTPDDAARLRGLGYAGLEKLTPDDMVILSFSGHGVTIDKEFYMVPSDAVAGPDGTPLPATLMSSTELTQWARRAEAPRMTMIIDACYSAASVAVAGFKPGPMGDAGLGQLAFDKGIRIIAATQAQDVALEDGALSHGLLTYALVSQGLDKGLADTNGDGQIEMSEWLRYGVAAVPALAAGLGRVSADRRSITAGTPPAATPLVQRPALFDFAGEYEAKDIVRNLAPPAPQR